MTEHYLKKVLAEMRKENLLESGVTRQGTFITEKGRQFLYEQLNF